MSYQEYSSLDDETLIQLVAFQRTEALSVLYDRYGQLIFSLAFHIVGTRELAEEVTQDAFTRLWDYARSYKVERSKVKTWLTSIARNRAIDEIRKIKSRPQKNSISFEEVDTIQSWVFSERDVESNVEKNILRKRIQTALQNIPPEQRVVILLAYFHGMTQSQIAEGLHQPLGTVKTRLKLGMDKLRKFLMLDETE